MSREEAKLWFDLTRSSETGDAHKAIPLTSHVNTRSELRTRSSRLQRCAHGVLADGSTASRRLCWRLRRPVRTRRFPLAMTHSPFQGSTSVPRQTVRCGPGHTSFLALDRPLTFSLTSMLARVGDVCLCGLYVELPDSPGLLFCYALREVRHSTVYSYPAAISICPALHPYTSTPGP